jgi:cytochrome c oxidase subunit 2
MLVANIPLLPDRAAEHAARVDYLFYYISAVTGLGGLIVAVLMIYFCAMYRRRGPNDRTPRIYGSHKLELAWTIAPTVLFLSFFAWGVAVYDQAFRGPADAPEIYVVGKQWMWKIQHPNGVREINEMHLLVGRPVKVTLISEDVIHSFGIPAFRDKIDVLPGRYVSTWYTPTKPGTYHLFCDQLCGIGHSQMVGWVHVMNKREYEDWLSGTRKPLDGRPENYGQTDGTFAWEGRQLFLKLQCVGCHNREQPRAPLLEGMYGREIPLQGGGRTIFDEGYIRESILKPRAKVHQGWEAIMPTFAGQLKDKSLDLSEEDALARLVAFIKGLQPGQTPSRTEHFWAPVGAPTELKDGKDSKNGVGTSQSKKEGAKDETKKDETKKDDAKKDEGGAKKGDEPAKK